MKKVLSVLLCFTFLISCAQKEIENYDKSPSYMLNVNFRGCSIEILINDIPVYHNFFNNKLGGVGGDIHINENILNSGVQDIKILIYPACDEKGKMDLSLDTNLYYKIQIDYGDFNNQKAKDFRTVYKNEYSKKTFDKIPKIIINDSFNAEVPYL